MKRALVIGCLIVAGLIACNEQRMLGVKEYLGWLDNESNGLVKRRSVNGIEIRAKFLPADYQAYLELKNMNRYTPEQADSIRSLYKNSLAFMISLGPDEQKGASGSIMYTGIENYTDYAQRVYDMNFDFAKYVTLKAGDQEYAPVLSSLDNVYGLSDKRSMILVFVPRNKDDRSLYEADKIDLVYNDELFELGTNHFLFARNDIKEIPALKF